MIEALLLLSGFVAVATGLWWISPPAALIVAGLLLMGAGVKVGLTRPPARRRAHAARSTVRTSE